MLHEATTIRKDFENGGTMAGTLANISESQNAENHTYLGKF